MTADTRRVVLFDGVCGLCTGSVRFIIRRDLDRALRFASLQSEVGAGLASHYGIDAGALDTLVLIDGGKAFFRSDAVLRIVRFLTFPWRLAGVLSLAPRWAREPFYRLIAQHRYRLFGRLDSDWVPPLGFEERFL